MARLLIIEDDGYTQDIYRTILEHHGHTVEVVGDGKTGVHRALTGKFDLMILDIGLPRMSGTEVLHRVRCSDSGREMGVLVVTAHGETMEAWDEVREQVSDVLTKPITPDELVREVDRYLEGRESAAESSSAEASEPVADDQVGILVDDDDTPVTDALEAAAAEPAADPLLLDEEPPAAGPDEGIEPLEA